MKAFFVAAALLFAFMTRSQSLVIHFDFDKSELKKAAKIQLDSFMTREKNNLSSARIEISGHCDFIGPDNYNDALSLRRVMTVKEYLEKNYLESGKTIITEAYGERKPLNENKTREDRTQNRRVELLIILPNQAVLSAKEEKPAEQKNATSLIQKIADTATKAGTSIILKNINFIGGRHDFLSESYPLLQELLETMRMYPKLVIEIQGHICCQPLNDDGLDAGTGTFTLSEERAKAVYFYLIQNGIEASRLSYKGYGHSAPIYPYPEQTEDERTENRRVEIKIINK